MHDYRSTSKDYRLAHATKKTIKSDCNWWEIYFRQVHQTINLSLAKKVLYPSTRFESSNQLNSKPSLLCFSCRKIGHLSYMNKLRFGMKHYNLKWELVVSCLMASNIISKDLVMWYVRSGCSRHMTGDPSIFNILESNNGRSVTFVDNGKGKIIQKEIVGKSPSNENIYLVDGLKHNLLSISQLCEANKKGILESSMCKIIMVILMKCCLWW